MLVLCLGLWNPFYTKAQKPRVSLSFQALYSLLANNLSNTVALAVHDLLPELQKDFEDSEEISLGSLVNYLNMMVTSRSDLTYLFIH